MNEIILHLKKHGESLGAEIAKSAGLSIDETRRHLSELTAKDEVMTYHSTRFEDGEKSKGCVAGILRQSRRAVRA